MTVVIFEHGLLSGGYAWAWVAERLPATVTAIVLDRRSTSVFDSVFRGLEHRAVLMRALATMPAEAHTSDVILVGHSVGGLLVRAHANAFGARVRGIVYVDPTSPSQFADPAEGDYRYLRLRRTLWWRTCGALVRRRADMRDVATARLLPEPARSTAIRHLTDHRFWLDAFRESGAARTRWLDAAIFPEVDRVPLAVVSSEVSRDPSSSQARFEQDLLTRAHRSVHIEARQATHETILYDERHSRAVNTALDWILTAEAQ